MEERNCHGPVVTMFNRFSDPALRVIFWARGEAGRLGSEAIEPEHLLLGVLLEDQADSASPRPAPRPELFSGVKLPASYD